jgi:hypothetical protein
MYGAGIPILFPIAVLSLVVLYIKERLCLAYSYRNPKLMLDNSLNRTALKLLTFPPLIYSAFAYWMFNNLQIFTNEVYYVPFFSSTIITGHTFRTMMSHTIPVLLAFGFSCTTSLLQKYLLAFLTKAPEGKEESHNFYASLSRKQRKHILCDN